MAVWAQGSWLLLILLLLLLEEAQQGKQTSPLVRPPQLQRRPRQQQKRASTLNLLALRRMRGVDVGSWTARLSCWLEVVQERRRLSLYLNLSLELGIAAVRSAAAAVVEVEALADQPVRLASRLLLALPLTCVMRSEKFAASSARG